MAQIYCYKDVLPFTAMVVVECTNVGLNTLFKAATLKGMSYYVFIVYSYAIATLVLLPLPFIFRSSAVLPSFKFPLIFRIFLLGIIGILAQICGCKGIEYSSPILASAISNLTPAFTFSLAIIFRMEKLALRSSSTHAKIIGTIVSISGALVVVLYKGQTILSDPSPAPPVVVQQPLGSSQSEWVIGGLLLAAMYLLVSIWYIIQTQVMKIYPAVFIVAFFYNLCATILSAPVCLILETNLSAWRLRPDVSLAAVIYSGFFGSFFCIVVHTWGLHLKGPFYIAIFKPLSIVIAAVMGLIFLGDALYLGSVIGAIIISFGFYAVLWGKAKEKEECDFSSLEGSSNPMIPLLQARV